MDFNTYQAEAQKTDRVSSNKPESESIVSMMVPLLGLAGETGELLSEYKKHLRDGEAHLLFKERIKEELGDLLWYLANVAGKFGLRLDDIAQANLVKTRDRWGNQDTSAIEFDARFGEYQRLPRQFEIELSEVVIDGRKKIRACMDGKQVGNDLTDNADDPDGYRFHDVFHLAYVAVLGWSPVIRKLLNRKRKDDAQVDEVQDGGRAQVIDEGIAALVFDYARKHDWLVDVRDLDYQLLRTIKGVTDFLEVRDRSVGEWQEAILQGFEVWRQVRDAGGGKILVDQDKRRLRFIGLQGKPDRLTTLESV